MQVAYGSITMAVYLVYYIPGFCKWMVSMPSDSFCLSKQVMLGPQYPPQNGKQNRQAELRRRQIKGRVLTEPAATVACFVGASLHAGLQLNYPFLAWTAC